MSCFEHFDIEMCFAPQRRALFRHLNSISKSGLNPSVFLHFWLWNVLRATTSCTSFFDITTSKSAPELRFCAFWLGNVLRARTACSSSLIWPAGSEPAAVASLLFDPPGPQIIGKTQCFATFLPFRAPGSSFFWDFFFLSFFFLLFSSLTLPTSSFYLSILSK